MTVLNSGGVADDRLAVACRALRITSLLLLPPPGRDRERALSILVYCVCHKFATRGAGQILIISMVMVWV